MHEKTPEKSETLRICRVNPMLTISAGSVSTSASFRNMCTVKKDALQRSLNFSEHSTDLEGRVCGSAGGPVTLKVHDTVLVDVAVFHPGQSGC